MENREEYRIAVCQFEPVFLDKHFNLEKMEDLAQRSVAAGAQLVIFPECCVTGYAVGKQAHEMIKQAEVVKGSEKGPSILRLEKLSNELNLQLIFGIPELVNDSVYNSAVHIIPEYGVVSSYYKIHMWETEGKVFKTGEEFGMGNGPAGSLGFLVCYDLEFPEVARILRLKGAQLLVVSTANMRPWEESQRVYARARAMENCVYVAIANCIGKSGSTEFFGGSIIVDPYGNVLTEAGTTEAVLVADINLELINKAVNETDYFNKRRPELYKEIGSSKI
ncbi:MAG: carbon-nitrogen hydrolase family protein [Planctomycetota bacterium]|jgi:predicted amidohydrolase